jgi:hypothetical protein
VYIVIVNKELVTVGKQNDQMLVNFCINYFEYVFYRKETHLLPFIAEQGKLSK